MAIYFVQRAADPGMKTTEALIVSAADATNAKRICRAYSSAAGDAVAWDSATATALADVACNATGALLAWTFNIVVSDTAGAEVANVTVTGAGSDDTIDEIAALLVTALNATASIAGAAYNSTSQVLTIAETTDGIGDHTVVLTFRPPSTNLGYLNCHVPGLIAAGPTHEGASGAALAMTFAADAYVRPTVLQACRKV
jgi:hypothetical protein